jgi:hypothetical protein
MAFGSAFAGFHLVLWNLLDSQKLSNGTVLQEEKGLSAVFISQTTTSKPHTVDSL